jgi:AmmeMemoRadiSam system protein B
VEVNTGLRDRLLKNRGVLMLSKFGHREEHAIEVQLPFLQRINPDIRIVPIVMGDQRGDFCTLLGELLRGCADTPGTVLIASTDLSHMYPDDVAKQLDAVARDDIASLSSAALLQHLASGSTEACGGGPVCAVMHACALSGADRATILHYCTSGDVTGETSRVVGYLSAAFTQHEQSGASV